MKKIKPISDKKFFDIINSKKEKIYSEKDFLQYFTSNIEAYSSLAIGPSFWIVGSRKDNKIIAVKDNVSKLSPFSEKEWLENGDPYFFANLFHPDDKNYVLSAFIMALELAEKQKTKQQNSRVNIYGRMLDSFGDYQWRLIQFLDYYLDENSIVESSLILITDISHLPINHQPMVTYFDGNNIENQYFKISEDQALKPIAIAKITKREYEILLLTSKGLNSPQIAEKLFISYHTVENHKRNLRIKTNTKTSTELITFAFKNNIF